LTLARLLVALNKPDEAMPFLDRLLRRAERLEMRGRTIGVQILRTLALNALEDERQALASLEQALSLGEPEGYVRVFLDEGPAMIKLLQITVSRGIMPVYARELLSNDDVQMMSPAVKNRPVFTQPLVEPLSERELQVLMLLGTNLTAPEIAEELFVAVSTIRTHTKNIYTKLGVHRRREAVDRARELGLI
jgi:LuxR family maltose regulon positive regulatory protein